MRIAVVGAGSTYTPELVSGLTDVEVDDLVLMDVDEERLELLHVAPPTRRVTRVISHRRPKMRTAYAAA